MSEKSKTEEGKTEGTNSGSGWLWALGGCGVALILITAIIVTAALFAMVVSRTGGLQAMVLETTTSLASAVGLGRAETVENVPDLEQPSLDELGLSSTETEPKAEVAAEEPLSQASASEPEAVDPTSTNESASSASGGSSSEDEGNSDGYSPITPPFIEPEGPVNTSNPVPLPPGLPNDFPTMSLEAQTQAMSDLIGLPLIPVPGEEGVAWNWNGKGVVNKEITCPSWIVCHLTLVDGNATVLFRGHGMETDVISAGTFRPERVIPGRGGLCFNRWMAEVYEASIVNILHILGEAQKCPNLPAQFEERINPALYERMQEVMELTGANGLIAVGTVKDGFGAFVIVAAGPETLDTFTCFDGAACVVDTGDGWQWVKGPVEVTDVQRAVLYDLAEFDSECEAFSSAQAALEAAGGAISGGPTCD